MNITESYKKAEYEKNKKELIDIYLQLAEMHERKLNEVLTKQFLSLAKEDVEKGRFSYDDLKSAMRESLRKSETFPRYPYFYKKIQEKKDKTSQKHSETQYNDLWSRLKSVSLGRFIEEDDTLYTIGIKYGMTAQIKASDKFTIGRTRKSLDDIIWKLRKKEIHVESDPRKELSHLFYEHSPFKFISGKDGMIYYENIRVDDRVFGFKDPRVL